ncbi:hypothetical protein [Luteimonas sp. SDU101]|uniref:hypothetical protein n=1 Tax=Luteimonas sp. SDU101 TaxID=3422593 RepID=UPI003EB89C8A
MTPAQHSISLPDFIDAVAQHNTRRLASPPSYARRSLLVHPGSFCALCDKPFDMSRPRGFNYPVLATCVHPSLGGPVIVDNFFVCCRRCQQSRASTDLLVYPNLPDHLAAQRCAALLLSDNHLVDCPRSAQLSDVRSALSARHALPRSRVYAAQSDDGTAYVGVSARYGDGQSKGLAHFLARLAGCLVHQDKQLQVYQLPDDAFRRTVWDLIEANALVVGVARRHDLRDMRDYWWLTSASAGQLKARRVGRVQVPFDEPRKEVGARALRARRLAARRRQERELDQAQARLALLEAQSDRLLAARSNDMAFPTDPGEGLELLRQYALAQELVGQLKTELAQAVRR